jgi:hypothetical protein
MAFPQTPLQRSLHIAPGANPADPSTFQFTEITNDVREDSGIQITAGRQDENSTVDTTGHNITLDNRSGNYSRRNPNGAYYGRLRKGTPIQTRVTIIDDLFARTVASGLGTEPVSGQAWTAGGSWSANGTNAQCALGAANSASSAILFSVGGDDVDILKCTSLSAVATGAPWADATFVRYQDSSNLYRVHTEYGTGGVISVRINRTMGGVTSDILGPQTTSVTYSAGTKIRTRIQAIGPTIRIKVWLDSGSEPAAWTASVNDISTTVRDNIVGLYQWRFAGNTNAGTMTCSVYEFRCDNIRATTPVPEWSPRWDQSAADATTPIVGAGILRRLSSGQSALRSPLYRGLNNTLAAAFWPLEDGTSSNVAASAINGVAPAQVSDCAFGSDGPPGADSSIKTNNFTSTIQGYTYSGRNTVDGYTCLIYVKFDAIPGSKAPIVQWQATGTITNWIVFGDSFGITVQGTDSGGNLIVNSAATLNYTLDPTKWFALQLQTNVSAGTVTWQVQWEQISVPLFFYTSGTYSGSAPKAIGFKAGGMANISYSMSWIGDNDLPFATGAFISLAAGFAGETAGNRAIRLAGEEGVPLIVMGNPNNTQPMGVQTSATFIDLIRECEDADQGLVVERGAGLGFLTYDFRTNVPVSVALDFAQGHISTPPEPTDDDLNLVNLVTITRKGGSAFTDQDPTSIALSGTYTDEATVNVQTDGQLRDQAGWRLRLGIIDELRWPQITLDLARNPSLIAVWTRLRIGSRITIANPPSAVAGGKLDLIVEGYSETLSTYGWDVELYCSPAAPWDVGVYNSSLYGSSSTTTGSTLAATTGSGQSLTLTYTTPGDRWSQTGTPYAISANGEQMTVTAMGAPSGTSPTISQVATVTRATNGVTVAHSVGEAVQISPSLPYSM